MKRISYNLSTNLKFYCTMVEKGDTMRKNKKGFTLVEIIVADIRGKNSYGCIEGKGNRAGEARKAASADILCQ